MRPAPWRSIAQFLGGIALVAALGGLVWLLRPRAELPPGWLHSDTGGDGMALALYREALWAGGAKGLVRVEPATGVVLEEVTVEGATLRTVSDLLVTRGDVLWVAHARGASAFDGTAWRTLTAEDGLPEGRLLALAEEPTGALWFGAERGLARCAEGACRVFTRADGLASDLVSVLFVDSSWTVWAGNGLSTEGGLSAWNGATDTPGKVWRQITVENGLAHPMVNAILEDREGALWFGVGFAARGGANRLAPDATGDPGSPWMTFTEEDGLAGPKVRSLFEDAEGALWFGSEYNGVARYADGEWLTLEPERGFSGAEIKAMLQTPDGALWFGTESGLTRISAEALGKLE